MAKPKKKTSVAKKAAGKTTKQIKPQSKPAKPSKPAPVAGRAKPVRETAASPAWDPNQVKVLVARVRAKWPALTTEEREAFDSLSDDEARAALGGRTRGSAVAAEAARWIGQIDKTLSAYALAREHYAPERFVYFLERLDALRGALAAQDAAGKSAGSAKTGAETAFDAARVARNKLLVAMEKFAGNRKPFRDGLGAARADLGSDAASLARSVREVVTLASAWIESGAPVLLKAARLNESLLAQARAAADALVETGADVTEAGPRRAHDTPTVNIAEGAVLEEMRRAKSDFDDAHEESPVIERLVPGPGTRSFFGARSANFASTAPTAPTAPSTPTTSTAPAAPPATPAEPDPSANAASSTSPTGPGVKPT